MPITAPTNGTLADATTWPTTVTNLLNNNFAGTTYTPTLSGMAIGTGGSAANTATYRVAYGILHVWGSVTFGTAGTTFPGATITVALPGSYTVSGYKSLMPVGRVIFNDAGVHYYGEAATVSNTTVRFTVNNSSTTYTTQTATSTTVPFTWVAGDEILYSYSVPVAVS